MIFWHKRKIDNFDPYNVFLAIATNITVMFYKTTSFETLFFLLLKMRLFTVKSVFSQVHHHKLHGENFYISLINIAHSYNKHLS